MNINYVDQADMLRYTNLLDELKSHPLPMGGSIVNDKGYAQHRLSYAGKQIAKAIARPLSELDRATCVERQRASSILVMAGMNTADQISMKTIELLDFIGVFKHGAVLVGSHAFAAIGNNLGVSWHDGVATRDVDIARNITVSHSSMQPRIPAIDMSKAMAQSGFEPIPPFKHGEPATNFRHANTMKIDVLTPMVGRSNSTPRMLSNMRVYAEPLRFLDYLIESPQNAIALTKYGTLIQVPQAARYAFHKCIIAQYRHDDTKRFKDIMQAEMILTVLEDRFLFLIQDAWQALPDSWQIKAQKGMDQFKDKLLVETINQICQHLDA